MAGAVEDVLRDCAKFSSHPLGPRLPRWRLFENTVVRV